MFVVREMVGNGGTYGSSNAFSTEGCRIPKTPIVWFLPPMLSLTAAEWP
jgi:hypothetical protein